MAHAVEVRAHHVVAENSAMTGTLQSGAKFDGILPVDASTGRAIVAKIFVVDSQSIAFDHVEGQGSTGYAYVVRLTVAAHPLGCPAFIFGERTTPDNFRGYGGGPLGTRTALGFCDGTVDAIASGSLMPDPRAEQRGAYSVTLLCPWQSTDRYSAATSKIWLIPKNDISILR